MTDHVHNADGNRSVLQTRAYIRMALNRSKCYNMRNCLLPPVSLKEHSHIPGNNIDPPVNSGYSPRAGRLVRGNRKYVGSTWVNIIENEQ